MRSSYPSIAIHADIFAMYQKQGKINGNVVHNIAFPPELICGQDTRLFFSRHHTSSPVLGLTIRKRLEAVDAVEASVEAVEAVSS
jgi:hypothetical protein